MQKLASRAVNGKLINQIVFFDSQLLEYSGVQLRHVRDFYQSAVRYLSVKYVRNQSLMRVVGQFINKKFIK
jgi:hypothetical protein